MTAREWERALARDVDPAPFVKRQRKRLGLSQTELGAVLGVHWTTVSRWERRGSKPTGHHLALLDAFRPATGAGLAAVHGDVVNALRALLCGRPVP